MPPNQSNTNLLDFIWRITQTCEILLYVYFFCISLGIYVLRYAEYKMVTLFPLLDMMFPQNNDEHPDKSPRWTSRDKNFIVQMLKNKLHPTPSVLLIFMFVVASTKSKNSYNAFSFPRRSHILLLTLNFFVVYSSYAETSRNLQSPFWWYLVSLRLNLQLINWKMYVFMNYIIFYQPDKYYLLESKLHMGQFLQHLLS